MSGGNGLGDRLADAVAGTPLADQLPRAAAAFLELRGADAAGERLDGALLRGLARVLASQPAVGGFLGHRPAWLERLADTAGDGLASRCAELAADAPTPSDDLEGALDEMRLLRREETCLAACHDLGGAAPFEEVSELLSLLAEAVTRRALSLARHHAGRTGDSAELSVIAMGKLAGREFTYHSDLDLIFLYEGGVQAIEGASRVGHRLISYLSTMTGAGVAYQVDMRLRPSGGQGTLVVGFEAFERYQREQAQPWEHLALLRARGIAGDLAATGAVLGRVQAHAASVARDTWGALSDLRRRVEDERAAEVSGIPIKTGAGVLMDVDFLAGGGVLEGAAEALPTLPSDAALLHAALRGARVERILDQYRFLRLVEARARWLAGRPIESIDPDGENLPALAELTTPGSDAPQLLARITRARDEIRSAWDEVVERGSIAALAGD